MIVIKMGGSQGVNLDAVCQDVAEMRNQGQQVILVHGGSAETNALSEQLGLPPRFLTTTTGFTSRYTNRETLEVFAMVTAGKINTILVEKLQKMGVNALGLSGVDGRLLVADRKEAIVVVENGRKQVIRDDYTGKIEEVNGHLLQILLAEGFVPVVAPLAISTKGEALNVDADRAAAAVAGAAGAEQLIILSNVSGLMKKFPDESTLIRQIKKADLDSALVYAEGRMKKKVLGAAEALKYGVSTVILADGRVDQPVQQALLGNGTVIQ
jgi:[amino group carrier protein]-L-2-aminoadipate 6-kinase